MHTGVSQTLVTQNVFKISHFWNSYPFLMIEKIVKRSTEFAIQTKKRQKGKTDVFRHASLDTYAPSC